MASRIRDDSKEDDSTLGRVRDKVSDAINTTASTISGVFDSVTRPGAADVTAVNEDYDDAFSVHTRSLVDKYDAFDNKRVDLVLTGSDASSIMGQIGSINELSSKLIHANPRPTYGEVALAPANYGVESSYFTSGAPVLPQYIITRASGSVPSLTTDIVEFQREVPAGIHSSLYTHGTKKQRDIDICRASGGVPAHHSYFKKHHNAVPQNLTKFGAPSASINIQGPFAGMQISEGRISDHDKSRLSRAMAIECNRHAADLDYTPSNVDFIANGDSVVSSIMDSIEREERNRLRLLESGINSRISARRKAAEDEIKGIERQISTVRSRSRERESTWQRDYELAKKQVMDEEVKYKAAQDRLARAHREEVGKFELECSQLLSKVQSARSKLNELEAMRTVTEPYIDIDMSDLNNAKAEEARRYKERLAMLDANERALKQRVVDGDANSRAFVEQEKKRIADAKAEINRARAHLREETQHVLSQLDAQIARRNSEIQRYKADLEAKAKSIETEIRTMEAQYKDNHGSIMKQRSTYEAELRRLSDEKRALEQRNDEISRASLRANAAAQAKAQAMYQEAEQELMRQRREIEIRMQKAIEERRNAVVDGGELRFCAEREVRDVIGTALPRERVHSAIGVEEHVDTVTVRTPQTVTDTRHIHLGTHQHHTGPHAHGTTHITHTTTSSGAQQPQSQQQTSWWNRVFGGNGKAEAAEHGSLSMAALHVTGMSLISTGRNSIYTSDDSDVETMRGSNLTDNDSDADYSSHMYSDSDEE